MKALSFGNRIAKFGNTCISAGVVNPTYHVNLIESISGTVNADPMKGRQGTIVTLSNEPAEGYAFDSYSITGAELTGNTFAIQNSDVSVEGIWGYDAFPITYESDEHVSITGDNLYIPGSTGITLQTGYDTYYRISGYDITGGTIENGVLYPTGPCTARAVAKLNSFTATGNFNFGTLSFTWNGQSTTPRTASKVGNAIVNGFTGGRPSNWPSNGEAWNVTDASAYLVKSTTTWSYQKVAKGRFTFTGTIRIGNTSKASVSDDTSVGNYYKTWTAACNMSPNSTQGLLNAYGKISAVTMSNEYRIWLSTNSWSATGYAP